MGCHNFLRGFNAEKALTIRLKGHRVDEFCFSFDWVIAILADIRTYPEAEMGTRLTLGKETCVDVDVECFSAEYSG